MESMGEIAPGTLPAGWSAGGAGAGDTEAAHRQTQQVSLLLHFALEVSLSLVCVKNDVAVGIS